MRRNVKRYWEQRRLKRIVQSEYQCKVYELTGWVDPHALPIWYGETLVGYDYTLGFLMRKVVPDYVAVKYQQSTGWIARINHIIEQNEVIGGRLCYAKRPEDALCKAIIDLHETERWRTSITKEAA